MTPEEREELSGIRYVLSQLLLALDRLLAQDAPDAVPSGEVMLSEPCAHPADSRIDVSTMGQRSFICNACGMEVA